MEKKVQLKKIAEIIGAEIRLPSEQHQDGIEITAVAPMQSAQANQITFLNDDSFLEMVANSKAGAVIVKTFLENCPSIQLVHHNPYYAFAKVAQLFVKEEFDLEGVSPLAFVHPSAKVGTGVVIYPQVYVSAGAEIGDHTVLYPGVFIGQQAKVGSYTRLRANVVIENQCEIGNYVLIHSGVIIGGDGFGFAPGKDDIAKIPQTGRVLIADHVEIGSSSTVDRGTMDDTKIGWGTKIDSQVHIAHNVEVGSNSMLCGGTMLAGSSKVGNWVVLAGSVNVSNKVVIADRVVVAAKSGVTKDILKPGYYAGYPTQPMSDWRKEIANIRFIPMLRAKLKELEQKIK